MTGGKQGEELAAEVAVDVLTPAALRAEVTRLREENAALRRRDADMVAYLRAKIDQLLAVIGTVPLRAEELDDAELVAFDPINIIAGAFVQILESQRHTNEQLRAARDEITAIFNSVGAGIMVLDTNQKILSFNHRLKELFFPAAHRVTGQTCIDILCRASAPPEGCVYHKVLASGHVETTQAWPFDDRYFDVIGAPVKDKKGAVTQVITVYTEVTKRKQAEDALLLALDEAFAAQELIEAVLRSVREGLLVTDETGRILIANPALLEMFSEQRTRVVGLSLATLFPDSTLAERFAEALASGVPGEPFDVRLEGVAPRSLQVRLALLRTANDTVRGGVVTLHDVTRERAIEQMKSDFVSTAAHELRTPLTAILGFSELLLDTTEFSADQRREFTGMIHSKAEDLAGIIDELLDITRIESGREIDLSLEAVRIDELAVASVDFFRHSDNRHRFEVSLSQQPLLVYADPRRIGQVFDNLISNAVKYSPAGGSIHVTLGAEGSFCAIAISDEGIGMSAEQIERVFDKFYRADASNSAVPGTGLGMTIVRQLVERHGGTIQVSSLPGHGTTIRFTLPLCTEGKDT